MSRFSGLLLLDDNGGRWHVCDTVCVRGREVALPLGSRRAQRRLFVPLFGQPRAYVFGPRESRQTGRARLLRQLVSSVELAVGSVDTALVDAILFA